MDRRQFLAASGTLAVAGCLRLSGEDAETTNESTTADAATSTTDTAIETEEATTTEATTEPSGPVTGLEADWTHDAGSNFDASVGSDAVVVKSQSWSSAADGATALAADAGDRRWTALEEDTVVTATPLPDGGAVLGTKGGDVAAVDADGAVRWRQGIDGAVVGRPAVADDAVIAGTGDDDDVRPSVVRLNADTGDVDWRVTDEDATADYDDAVGIAVVDDVAYVGYTNGVAAYALDGGAKQWGAHANLNLSRPDSLLVGDDLVYAHRSPGLAAYDRATGAEAWFFEPFDDFQTRLVPGDGVVYAGSGDASVYAIERDGSERWRTQIAGPVTQVAAAGDALFASVDGGDVAVLARADGAQRTSLERGRTDVLAAAATRVVTADGSTVTGHALVRDD
ncbi:PQQ-binding-like beta-propeller repeat protein [Halorubellus sp. JP-L1]|uniref:outer membrane protein assembly factor BamB family protein n=1 Tax=Halorubellus sp. JP-L1 TaxID=2715753 RepID=UPI001407BEF9|nr:PQQ-binding-like beta-propeller repeat protein [Halorubellus sp. JP-L1]NHN43363.1 PQQ-binding-like beta-propeller repeat protein [Halorubellus sp. JP-L1]